MMTNPALNFYVMVVAYDGTDYFGWQYQDGLPTIEGVLRKTFRQVFGRDLPRFLGASRTDAGVHAQGQVVRFATEIAIEPTDLLRAWNGKLPNDIVIRSIQLMGDGFHPHHNIEQKTYHYYFSTQLPLPFAHRYVWFFRYSVDIEKLNKALQVFVGTHDFTSFATEIGDQSPIRRVDSMHVEWVQEWQAYRIVVKGPSFLRYMIRRMVGAALKVASSSSMGVSVLQQALAEKNPHQELPSAAARGLCLHEINYTSSCGITVSGS